MTQAALDISESNIASARVALPREIRTYLRAFVLRRKMAGLLRALGIALAIFLLWLLCECLLDRLLHLTPTVRMTLLVLQCGIAGSFLVVTLARLLIPTHSLAAAAAVEAERTEFGERLITVVSYARQEGSSLNTSPQMMQALMSQVASLVATGLVAQKNLSTRQGLRRSLPWLLVLFAATAIAALWPAAWLGLPQLVGRALRPLSSIPEVTLTHIEVDPQGADVSEGDTITIRASANRYGDRQPILLTSTDHQNWTRVPMLPAETGEESAAGAAPPASQAAAERESSLGWGVFKTELHAGYRDIEYRVKAGDAQSPIFTLRVKRPPTVSAFEAHYQYPPYLNRPPLVVRNTDGLFEAPVNTQLALNLIASEPLASASLMIYGKRIALQPTSDAAVWTTTFSVTRDSGCSLDMLSTMGVDGHGPLRMRVQALTDRPPTVRLLEPGEAAMPAIVLPRQTLKIRYSADDPYSIEHMALGVQVNGILVTSLRVPAATDSRSVQGEAMFDLASATLRPGDIVALTLRVEDPAGQSANSQRRFLMVSTVGGDVRGEQCLLSLETAEATSDELREALNALRNEDPAHSAADAVKIADRLRLELLAAVLHCNEASLADAIGALADQAVRVSSMLAELPPQAGVKWPANAPRRIVAAMGQAADLKTRLESVAAGQRAALLLSQWEGLKAVAGLHDGQRPRGARQQAMVNQIRRRWEQAMRDAGIAIPGDPNPSSESQADLPAEVLADLRRRVFSAQRIVSNARPLDTLQFRGAAGQGLAGRFTCAAMVAALRPTRSLADAREALDLCQLGELIRQTPHPSAGEFARAWVKDAALIKSDDLLARYKGLFLPQSLKVGINVWSEAAAAARENVKRRLNQSTSELESALRVNLDPPQVVEIEHLLAAQMSAALPAANDAAGWNIYGNKEQAIAQSLEEIALRSPRLTDPNHPDAIDSRHKALLATAGSRGHVAFLAQREREADEACQQAKVAIDQAIDAYRPASTGRSPAAEAIRRANEQTAEHARGAYSRAVDAARALLTENISRLADGLQPYQPETLQALEAIDGEMKTALSAPLPAGQMPGARGVDLNQMRQQQLALARWLQNVETATDHLQHALDIAEQSLADEDLASGTAWFASQAAASAQNIAHFETTAPTTSAAAPSEGAVHASGRSPRVPMEYEMEMAGHWREQCLLAIVRLRAQAASRASAARLAAVPEFAAVFQAAEEQTKNLAADINPPFNHSISEDHSRVRPAAAKSHEPAPAGYGDAIHAYFDDLESARHESRR